jgi:pimeloyl-ACP methyl ester carboxylesterase
VRGNLALALQLDTVFGNGKRPARWPRAGTVRAAGLHTSYLEAGRGTPVLLLHGLGATNASLLPTIWDLARDHRVIAPDLPGFGESAKPIRSYHARFFARWLAAFLHQIGVERADLIGNSMGGRVAIEVGLQAPERVYGLGLLCPAVAFMRRGYHPIVRLLRPEFGVLPHRFGRRTVTKQFLGLFADPSVIDPSMADVVVEEFSASTARPAPGWPSCRRPATSTWRSPWATAASTPAWPAWSLPPCSCGRRTTGSSQPASPATWPSGCPRPSRS